MSTWRQIQVTDHRGVDLIVTQHGDGTIEVSVRRPPGGGDANFLPTVDLDEVDRQRLRDFLAGS